MNDIEQCNRCITFKGSKIAWAITYPETPRKNVENRSIKISPGWCLMHVGKGKLSKESCQRIDTIFASHGIKAPREADLPHSAIVGVMYISHSSQFEEEKPNDPILAQWSTGPVLNHVKKAYAFETPISDIMGKLSIWRLNLNVDSEKYAALQRELHRVKRIDDC